MKLVPWINPGSGSRVWTYPVNAYVFSTFPSYVTEGRILAKYAAEELPAEKYAMLYQDDSFGREGQEGVRLGLRGTEKEIVIAETYAVGDEDLSDVAAKFHEAEIDLIFVWTISEGAAALVKALDAIEDYSPQIVATQVLSDPVMFDLAGPSWEGVIVASSVPETDSDEPGVAKARQIIAEHGEGIEFGTYAMWGLARAEVLVEGMRLAGPELTRLKLIQALEGIDNWSDNFLGTPVSFSEENHQGLNAIHLSKAERGRLVDLSGWLES
jgi:ABC-type branched-subunit amino acid transport system substrate-binding protein